MTEHDFDPFVEWLGFDPGFPEGCRADFSGSDLVVLTLPLEKEQALRTLKQAFARHGFPLNEEKSLPNEGKYRFISEDRKFYIHVRGNVASENQTLINITDATEQSAPKFTNFVRRFLGAQLPEGASALESGTLDIPWQKPEGTIREAMDRVDQLLQAVMNESGFTQHPTSHPEDGIYLYTSATRSVEAHFFPSIEDPYNKWGDGMGFIISMRLSSDALQEF